MALVFCDGFDRYQNTTDLTTLGWLNNDSTNITLDATGSQWGGKALKLGDLSTAGVSTFPGISRPLSRKITGNTLRMAFWIKTAASMSFSSGLTGGETLFYIGRGTFATSNGNCITSMINSSGAIDVYKFDTATSNSRDIVGTGALAINDGNWHHFEMEFVANPTSGSVKTWIDGVADLNVTGADTSDAGGTITLAWANTVKLSGGKRAPGSSDAVWYDDVIIWDDDTSDSENTMSGALASHIHRIETKIANSDNSVQFTRSTGSFNYTTVDDLAPYNGDTDYNSSSTPGHVDLFGMATSSVFADVVYAVNVCVVARKTSSSNGLPKVRAKSKNAATTRSSAKQSVWHPSSYTVLEMPMCKDPDGAGAWTHSSLQSTLFGYERID